MALTLTIGGISYLAYMDYKTAKVQDSQEVKGDVFDFTLHIYNHEIASPKEGKEVIFSDGATREFGGVLVGVTREMGESNKEIIFHCHCSDYTYYLDRRYLVSDYNEQAAGLMVKAILQTLKDASESDAHYTDFNTDLTQIANGPTLRKHRFDHILPSQALDQIAEETAMMWWIGFDKRVYFVRVEDVNSIVPSPLTDSTLNVDTDTNTFHDISDETTLEGVGNKAILRDVTIKSTSSFTYPKTWHTGDDRQFRLDPRPFSFLDVISVKKNAVAQNILTEHVDGEPTDASSGVTDVFVKVDSGGSYVRFGISNPLANGDAIEIVYNYATKIDWQAPDTASKIEMAARTGGDGVHEFVYTKSSGIRAESNSQIDVVADIILERKRKILRRGSFWSFKKGWKAGQILILKWDWESIYELVWITTVNKVVMTPANDPNTGDSVVVSQVYYSNVPRGVQP